VKLLHDFRPAARVISTMRTALFLPVLLSLAFLFPSIALSEKIGYQRVIFEGAEINAEVADTPQLRKIGLMFRESLSEEQGMLFVFPEAAPHRFWMKNVRVPLDMIWLDSNKQIIHIAENLLPCVIDPCAEFGPEGQASLFVIETVGGFAKKHRLKRGMHVKFKKK